MSEQSRIDLSGGTPEVEVPRDYNATHDLVERNLREGRGGKTAIIDDAGSYTYEELSERVNKAAGALSNLGVGREQRVTMCMLDSVDFPAVFWGALKIGAVPVPLNTLLTTRDYDFMLRDSRAEVLVVSNALLEKFEPVLGDQPFLRDVVVAGDAAGGPGRHGLDSLLADAAPVAEAAATVADDVAFWLYTSGSTGQPKGVVHLHSHLVQTAVHYGYGVLGIKESDVVFSAAKLFFAYGLGNGMSFPLLAGATAVLMAERPTPQSVMQRLKAYQPTIFFGVPTLYGAILADESIGRSEGSERLRLCVSAGEALPEDIGRRWNERFGVDVIDGIGSTEMLHIFLTNVPGDVRYGTTGKAVPGYKVRVLDDDGAPVPQGELGELWVSGPSGAMCYWNKRSLSQHTFQGTWTRTGDKYSVDEDGYYVYSGRTDDMLKVGGIYVSPFEVESALLAHEAVAEAAVVGHADDKGLVKPKAFVVPKAGNEPGDKLADELKRFVKDRLAQYKYPRWIEFRGDLPKTATGKIQRFKLRDS